MRALSLTSHTAKTMSSVNPGISPETVEAARTGGATRSAHKSRREDLDRAKGLGIVLVVLGHIVAREYPPGNHWFAYVKTGLYEFHMPFFMYLSGYVTFLTGAARARPGTWLSLFGKRAVRLLVPFLIFGLSIAAGKAALAPYLHIDNPAKGGFTDFENLLWHTDQSVALSIWYMAVLFMLSCATPVLLWVLRGNTLALLAITAVLYLLPIPAILYLDRAATYFVFFVIGGIAAEAGGRWLRALDRNLLWSWVAFLTVVTLGLVAYALGEMSVSISLLVCGVASMPALHGLVRRAPLSSSQLLLTLGAFSFVIYILNTPAIGLAKALMWKVAPWDGVNFLIYAPALLAAGVLVPIAIKVWLFRRLPVFDRMTQ